MCFAALLSTAVSATIGTTSLLLGEVIHGHAYSDTWLAWWIGDMLGDLVFAPVLLVWSARPRLNWRETKVSQLTEVLALGVLLVGIGIVVFHGSPVLGITPLAFDYMVFPILILTALRFGQRGSVTAVFLLSLTALWSVTISSGTSDTETLKHNYLSLQSFMGITAATFMVVAALMSEKMAAQQHQLELAQKNERLSKQRVHLMALNKAKDEFVSLVSHQLKTPPTVVKQYVGMLLGNYGGKLTATQRDMLTRAYNNNERLINIIHHFLHLAQLDAGRMILQKERVDLAALITEILQEHEFLLAERHHTVKFIRGRGSFVTSIDKTKFGTVIENLLDNASKYTPPDKSIAIKLTTNQNKLTISITDEGIGISPGDIKKLFKKFSRLNRSTAIAVSGTGIGLYLAKKIIELHKGTISVTSEQDKGATFTVTLPHYKRPNSQTRARISPSSRRLAKVPEVLTNE